MPTPKIPDLTHNQIRIQYDIHNCYGNGKANRISQEGTCTGLHNRAGEWYLGIRYTDPSTGNEINEYLPLETPHSQIVGIIGTDGSDEWERETIQTSQYPVDPCPILAIISNSHEPAYKTR